MRYGFEKKWLRWRDLIGIADAFLASADGGFETIELATLTKVTAWKAGEFLNGLCDDIVYESGLPESRHKWLLAALLWLYEHSDHFDDPLAFAEDAVDDVDYPSDALRWLRVQPPQDGYHPREHSYEENIERLNSMWKDYLRSKASSYLKNYEAILNRSEQIAKRL